MMGWCSVRALRDRIAEGGPRSSLVILSTNPLASVVDGYVTRQQDPNSAKILGLEKAVGHQLTVHVGLINVFAFAVLQKSAEICRESPVSESAIVPPGCSWMSRDEFIGSFSLSSCPVQIPLLSPPPSVRKAECDCLFYFRIEKGKRTLSGSGSVFGLCT